MAGTSTIGDARPQDTGARKQGRYVLGDLLGRGGMAEVFAGNSLGSHGFQKPVAIKRLLPELANDHVFVERLIGEAKLLVGMQHGNIVSVLDLARDGDDVFLVMEFVDGPSLRQLLKARGQRGLPLGIATYIVQAAAAGLEFAHARPGGAVIHADISPSNLLLTTSGEVRVADFGIARREGGGAGVVEGKWAYMAPEQARGEPLTPRSDVFALGVVLYELCTGEHPLGRQVTADERGSEPLRVIPPRVVRPNIPPGLDAICMRALAYDPRDRYARMQQLIDAIVEERFANGYREGANDLAQAIREIAPGGSPAAAQPRTQHTDKPLTIVTRSLISQPQRMSATAIPADAFPIEATRDAATNPRASQQVLPALALAMPPVRPSATPAEVERLVAEVQRLSSGLLPTGELISVHGGNTVTGAAQIDVAEIRNHKWTFAVLGIAAVVGVIAAIGISAAPEAPAAQPDRVAAANSELPALTTPTIPDEAPVAAPPPTPIETAAPTPTETVAPSSEPTVPPVAETKADDKPLVEDKRPWKKQRTVPALVTKPAPKKDKTADAQLIVKTEDMWAFVTVNNQRKESPPNASFKLPGGTHRIIIKNTDGAGITFACTVTVDPGKVKTVSVVMEERRCYE